MLPAQPQTLLRRKSLILCIAAALPLTPLPVQAGTPEPGCDQAIAPISNGYGAEGHYGFEQQTLQNPSYHRHDVQVFLPAGAHGPRPVIFFAHGYGPNVWEAYSPLFHHWVSRGYVVVYSTYPAFFASHDERYDDLWSGFTAAADHFSARMDLDHVGFVGHSYGGGAAPTMASRGLTQKGWGKKGAFIAALAPWYTFELTREQQKQLPATVPQLYEVYQDDNVNDHRMAIDDYKLASDTNRWYLLVHSSKPGGCDIVADHSMPGRSPLLRLKQYGLFRPLDALVDVAFTQDQAAREALNAMGSGKSANGFEPLERLNAPQASHDENFYRWPWSDSKNPRR